MVNSLDQLRNHRMGIPELSAFWILTLLGDIIPANNVFHISVNMCLTWVSPKKCKILSKVIKDWFFFSHLSYQGRREGKLKYWVKFHSVLACGCLHGYHQVPAIEWLQCLMLKRTEDSKYMSLGNSLAVQWLGLHAFTVEGESSISGQDTKIPQASRCSQKKQKNKKKHEPWDQLFDVPTNQVSSWVSFFIRPT